LAFRKTRLLHVKLPRFNVEKILLSNPLLFRGDYRVFDQAPGMTAILQGPELVYEVVNRAYRKGLRGQKLIGRPYKEAHPELENQGFFDDLDTVVASGAAVVGRERRILLRDPDGGELNEAYIDFVFQPLFAPDGAVSGIFIQANDVTTKVRAKRALERSNERWKLAVEDARDGVWEWNPQTDDVMFSRRWKEMLGYHANEIANTMAEWESRVHPDDHTRFAHERQASVAGHPYHSEHRLRCKDGSWKWVLARAVIVDDCEAGPTRMTGTLSDISQKKEWEEQIWRHANFDALTGLPNRRLFREHLRQELEKGSPAGARLAIMYIDLDYFKQVNDLLGHDAGDLLLTLAGRRLTACIKEGEFLARVGGDEFFLLIPEVAGPADVERLAGNVVHALTTPFHLEAEVAHVSASIGITLYPDDATTSEGLIRNADQAMYAAKRSGRNQVHFFTASMRDEAQRRVQLGRDLRHAIAGRQLEVHYQPIVHLASGKILKAEALLRWNHPELGRVAPSLFIPIAEETGLINAIGDWVMNEVASWLSGWMTRTGRALQVSVNRSPVQLLASGSTEAVLRTAASFHLPPNSIVLEITEGVLLNATPVVANALLQCRDAGIQVALDDFGTGYSSMAYLKKFDIDFLKIDRSFVQDLETDPGSLAIAESIVMMAHRLDMKVIAEGIESAGQREILVRAGCDLGQGYLFSKPVPVDEFERLLEENARHEHPRDDFPASPFRA